jgi:phosphoribosylglycinamide formyltransferase 2
MKRIMLLGSGELGKEFVISAKRLGYYVIACDNYLNAPAMQVADIYSVFNMLDPESLRYEIDFFKPDIIVPEIEAIATEVLYEYEANGIQVVPSARAVNLTMNRDKIRDRAAELGLETAKYAYAESLDEYIAAVATIGLPCVVKPVMSSSGKGQSIVRPGDDILDAYQYALSNMRGDRNKVIVEEFIAFDSEITLLTIKQKDGPTMFCEPIGHVQERGDYQYSWQPYMQNNFLREIITKTAQDMAKIITDDLGGAGLFGVEFFLVEPPADSKDNVRVIFSELSPRPHDTGMVTLRSQRFSEFDLHLRAIMGLPIRQLLLFFVKSTRLLYQNMKASKKLCLILQ